MSEENTTPTNGAHVIVRARTLEERMAAWQAEDPERRRIARTEKEFIAFMRVCKRKDVSYEAMMRFIEWEWQHTSKSFIGAMGPENFAAQLAAKDAEIARLKLALESVTSDVHVAASKLKTMSEIAKRSNEPTTVVRRRRTVKKS